MEQRENDSCDLKFILKFTTLNCNSFLLCPQSCTQIIHLWWFQHHVVIFNFKEKLFKWPQLYIFHGLNKINCKKTNNSSKIDICRKTATITSMHLYDFAYYYKATCQIPRKRQKK